MRRAHQQRVAGACGVEVVSAVVVDQTVVGAVVDALEAEGRSTVVAFGGVVVHHVEDDFHAGMMVCLDHGLNSLTCSPRCPELEYALCGAKKPMVLYPQ